MRLHATCIAIGGHGVLLAGRSGSGKSDLALRLIDRGAQLVSDDYTELWAEDGMLMARAPATIAGNMEVRGVGIISVPAVASAPVALHVTLDGDVPRLPDPDTTITLAGIGIPSFALAGLEASAPIKLERLLAAVLEPARHA